MARHRCPIIPQGDERLYSQGSVYSHGIFKCWERHSITPTPRISLESLTEKPPTPSHSMLTNSLQVCKAKTGLGLQTPRLFFVNRNVIYVFLVQPVFEARLRA